MKGAPQSYKKSRSPKEGGFLFRTTQLLQSYFPPASIPPDNRVNATALDLDHKYGHHFAYLGTLTKDIIKKNAEKFGFQHQSM